jgi:hypothetical protein
MKLSAVAAIAALGVSPFLLGGCASSSDDIAAAYISPLAYDNYTCPQLAGEMQRISARVNQVTGSVDDRATNDKIAMGVGLVIFWPALFMLKGNGPQQQELATLKGEYDAVNQASIKNNCGSNTVPAAIPSSVPTATPIPIATSTPPSSSSKP